MADKKRIRDLNALQDKLYKRLHDVEARIRALEEGGNLVIGGRGLPLLDKNQRIGQAAWELEDAIFDRALPKYEDDKSTKQDESTLTKYPDDLNKARAAHVGLMHANNSYNTAIVFLIILTFVEVPPWCHAKHGGEMAMWTFKSGAEWCPLPPVPGKDSNPNLSGIAYLPPGFAFIVEIGIEWFFLSKFWKEFNLERDHFKPIGADRKPLNWCGFVCAIGSIIDTACFMLFRVPFRLTFIFRTGLIFLLPGVQHIFNNIFNRTVLTEFGSVVIFLLGTMLFFAWIGLTVFQNANVLSYMDGEEKVMANKGFTTFSDSINTMFIGGVTGEFIDCFLPSFNVYRGAGPLWMLYLCLTQVLFKNLVMDTLISAYLKGKDEEDAKIVHYQIHGMKAAFGLLSDDGEIISKEDFMEFIKVLRRSPRWAPSNLEALEMMYDEFGTLNKENFVNMCCLVQSEFKITDLASPYLKDNESATWITEAVWETSPDEPPAFDKIMNTVLMVNLGMVLVESTYDLLEIPEPAILDTIELVFAFTYVGEVAVKLAVKSFAHYWASGANQFDFFCTWLLLSTSVLKYLPFASIKGDLSKYANILRLLRLIRILKQLKQYPQVQFMMVVITRIMTCAGEVLELMGTFFFFFCTLAVNLFGGLLHEGNEALDESEYAEKHWYLFNFNDMFMAFMTWFVQVICEYVPNYTDALTRTSTAAGLFYGPYSGLIVLFFYITTAAIMYELLLAFTVDVFIAVKEEVFGEDDEEIAEEKEEERMEESEAKQSGEGESVSSSSSSSSESEFDIEEFVTCAQEKIFNEREEMIHCNKKVDKALQEEFNEKYEKIVAGSEEEERPDLNVCKAAWMFENAIWNQHVTCQSKNKKLDGMRAEKEESEDPERVKQLAEEIQDLCNDMETYPTDIEKARDDHIQVLQATKTFNKAMIGLVLLTITEVPSWCHSYRSDHLSDHSWAPGYEWCRAPEPGANMYLSGIWYLPPAYALIIEIIIELIILRRYTMEYQMEKDHFMPLGEKRGDMQYSNIRNIYVGCICSVGSIIDTGLFSFFRLPYRCTFLFRTGLLCLLPGVQRLSARIFNKQMLGQFFSVAVFFIGTVFFFAWIAVTIYKDSKEVVFVMAGEDVIVGKGFESLSASVYTMFLAGMTEGFDDLFIPTVTSNRAAAVLWLVFLVLTQVLFLNLVIDAFVAAYLESSEKNITLTAHSQALSAYHTSTLLFEEKMEKKVFMQFMAELTRSPRMRDFTPKVAEALYDQFMEEEGDIDKDSFCDLVALVQNQIWVTPKNSCVETTFPGIWKSDWFGVVRKRVWEPAETPWFDEVMDTVLLFNLCFVVAQSVGGGVMTYIPKWLHLSTFFTLVYVFELAVKLSVKSWAEYCSFPANKFDFATTWILFFTWSLQFINIQSLQQDLMRYANLLRLLRLLRVAKKLKKYPRVQFMVTTVVRMVEAAGDILELLGVVLFFFTTFSVNFFGGLLYEGNSKLHGSDYDEKHWYVFNFNDVLMGYVTWFTQLLCEYSPEWADALYRTSAYGAFSWYIYPTFYIFGVAIVFEILQAFTIETYLALKEEADDEEDESESDSDEEEAFEVENKVIEAVQEKLSQGNRWLHPKITLLPALQKQIKSAYAEMLEEDEEGGSKKSGGSH